MRPLNTKKEVEQDKFWSDFKYPTTHENSSMGATGLTYRNPMTADESGKRDL